MSSKPDNKTKLKDWEDQTPVQRLSNRTILRFQQLADELKNDLGRVISETGVKSVLFVSADRGEHRFDQNPNSPRRFYNALLLRTYQFTDENDKVWQWIKNSLEGGSVGWKKTRVGFEQLFELSAEIQKLKNQFPSFENAVKQGKEDDKEKAHDLLIDAIATLPYTGFLLGRFDTFSRGKQTKRCLRMGHPINTFKVIQLDNKKGLFVEMKSSCANQKNEKNKPKKIELKKILSNNNFRELAELFPKFIDHFVMGREAVENPTDSVLVDIREEVLPKGLFIPVYDFNDESGRGAGGFEGWLVVLMDPLELEVGKESAIEMAVQNFASRASEERMRELIERPWTDAMSPAMFTKQNYGHYGGWEGVLESEPKFHSNSKIPYVFLKKSKNDLIPTSEDETTEITHIAIHIRANEKQGQNLWLVFRKRCDTILPQTANYLENYGYQIARSVNDLYQAARLRHEEIQRSQQSGFLASAHDYSKDIGSVLLRLERFKEELECSAKSITEKAQQVAAMQAPACELGSSILEDLRSWNPPYLDDSFANVRFTNAHLQTQTRGVLINEPAECVARLERGTLRDIYEVVRILVWHPIPFPKFKEKESEYTQFAPEKLRDPSTWWNLFMFDLDPLPDTEGFHKSLGERLRTLILDEKIDHPAFAQRFHIPRICPDVPFDDPRSILWPDTDPSRWKELNGLLPLFVFSMRFAFQCAWARTLLEEPAVPLGITIEADASQHRQYTLTLSFPSPLNDTAVPFEKIPYAGEWRAQIRHYTPNQTAPWRVTETVTPSSTEGANIIRIQIRASI